ncbi:zip metal ion transporter [Grosmannia clavigera kw1407]|uniref:Zip metal ion transporter n=1 Tax=Grosmannia clavigera (strain kw1407 / UAMH 11150) TaxID=655863 RepID=F0XH11_GROCL|nr:zip metal ion transporter [Grosmannia clavigera kw1407]EFX02651.1 zip metal ion transporter [Grosmannia clavigera kw1407]
MGGLLLLLALSAVMALASFLAGALPLSMTLTQSQLRFVSSIGVGILVGTSLIVIIPEGVEAVVNTYLTASSSAGAGAAIQTRHTSSFEAAMHQAVPRSLVSSGVDAVSSPLSPRALEDIIQHISVKSEAKRDDRRRADDIVTTAAAAAPESGAADSTKGSTDEDTQNDKHGHAPSKSIHADSEHKHEAPTLPTFQIGFALVSGFVCMFLIDRLPRHAVDRLQTVPTTRHISLDNLGLSGVAGDSDGEAEEEVGFLGSLTPTPRQSRGLATTAGLVIHAAADGIAMGASATTEDMKLGLVIFVAIMLHKAPAAFGLTSVLLKHGLSKRAARGHLVLFSLAAPFGALSTYIFITLVWGSNMEGERGQYWTGLLLLFSAGTFLYVAMQAMQDDSGGHEHHLPLNNSYAENGSMAQRRQNRPQMRDTVATIVGMLLPLLTQFGHHH